jgi:alcohol dehydrogenase
MKAAVITQFGEDPSQCISVVNTQPIPLITPTECLVRVLATSINPVDWKIMKGYFPSFVFKTPLIPCFDISGVVTQVGTNCKRLKVGDAVYGMTKSFGLHSASACADFVAISERCLAKIPTNLTFAEAASFPLVGMTTIQSIGKYTKDGTKVLILGGSGGVGSFTVQYCKAKGCHVAVTCGERNIGLMKELGAETVINYREQNWFDELAGANYDLIYDTVGGIENWKNAEKVLKKKGVFATISGDEQSEFTAGKVLDLATSYIGRNIMSLFNKPSYSLIQCNPTKASTQLLEIRQLIEGGFIRPIYSDENIFNIDNIKDAFSKSMEGRTVGKLIVVLSSDAEKKADELK